MFCPNCGCWNPDDSTNCSACATALQAPAAAAPVNAVSNTSFVERWRKIATSPILLILAAVISIQAILSFEGIFDTIGYGFDLMGYNFLAGLLAVIGGITNAAIFLAAAGLWLTYLDATKKDKADIDTLGIKLTIYALLIQLAALVLTLLGLLVGAEATFGLGSLMSSDLGGAVVIIVIITIAIGGLYYGLMYGAANGAKKAAETKTVSVACVGGAAVICYVFGALALIGLLSSNSVGFGSILGVATTILQGVALSQYKSAMTK